MPTSWKNRSTYGKLLRRIIIRQVERFNKCNDDETATKIAGNIGYLIDKLHNFLKHVEIQDEVTARGRVHVKYNDMMGM